MKQKMRTLVWGIVALIFSASFVACKKDKKESVPDEDQMYASVLDNYVESTIKPTYKALAEAALEMRTANEALKANPSDANMKRASDAWMAARVWWEKSEAFLFGPVGEQALDIDGHIDSWPLELQQIQAEIAKGAGAMTGKRAWKELDAEVIGFHVTEYLLYREGKSRPVADLSAAELNYLTAATDALVWDCVLAYVAWVGEENVSTEMKNVFNENPDVIEHLNDNPNYKNFAKKLTSGEGYPSMREALNQIAVGAAEIAGEVGATKIENPYVNHRVEDVESWYSWHSLDDYQNNIQSIKNAYLGGTDQTNRTNINLSSFVKSKNAGLDTEIKAKIDECIATIYAIGGGTKSFYEVVRDRTNKTEVDAAVKACGELETLFTRVQNL